MTNDLQPLKKHQLLELEPPYSFQKGRAIFWEPGCGKTRYAFEFLRSKINTNQKNLCLFLTASSEVLINQTIERFNSFFENFISKERINFYTKKNLEKFTSCKQGVNLMIFGYQSLDNPRRRSLIISTLAKEWDKIIIFCDESHYISNSLSKSWKNVFLITRSCRFDYIRLMTGTPPISAGKASNNEEYYAQFRIIDDKILNTKNLHQFRTLYRKQKSFHIPGTLKYFLYENKNTEKLVELISPHCSYVKSEDVFKGTENFFFVENFDLDEKNRDFYNQIKKNTKESIQDYLNSSYNDRDLTLKVKNLMSKLETLSCGFVKILEDGKEKIEVLSKKREDILFKILEEKVKDGKAIIWVRFVENQKSIIDRLLKNYGRENLSIKCNSNLKEKINDQQEFDNFLSGKTKFLISSKASLGAGIEIKNICNHMIYFSNDFFLKSRFQSMSRTNRIGSEGHMNYYDLCAIKTIDETHLKYIKIREEGSNLTFKKLCSEILKNEN